MIIIFLLLELILLQALNLQQLVNYIKFLNGQATHLLPARQALSAGREGAQDQQIRPCGIETGRQDRQHGQGRRIHQYFPNNAGNKEASKKKGELFRRIKASTVWKLINQEEKTESIYNWNKPEEDARSQTSNLTSVTIRTEQLPVGI